MSAADEALGTADRSAGHAGPGHPSARLAGTDVINIVGAGDGASSDGARTHPAGWTGDADGDIFAAIELWSTLHMNENSTSG
jgi:hypothetical protein